MHRVGGYLWFGIILIVFWTAGSLIYQGLTHKGPGQRHYEYESRWVNERDYKRGKVADGISLALLIGLPLTLMIWKSGKPSPPRPR